MVDRIEINRLADTYASEIVGADLSRPLDASALARVRQALAGSPVVVFREQSLDKAAQLAFTRQFGEIDVHAAVNAGADIPEVHTVSNLNADGEPDRAAFGSTAWHSDKSYRLVPSTFTVLHAVELPRRGGDTGFGNCVLGYEALPADERETLAGLRVVHSWERSVAKYLGKRLGDEERRQWPAVAHPLACTHPDSGRRALFIGQHAAYIEGMALAEGEALLARLLAHVTSEAFVYRHRWRPGDVLMWDNRCLVHRAMDNFAVGEERRILHRTVTRGLRAPS